MIKGISNYLVDEVDGEVIRYLVVYEDGREEIVAPWNLTEEQKGWLNRAL